MYDLPILEKSLFDIDSLLGQDERDKNQNDYSGNQQSFDRIAHFLQLQKEKMEKGENPEKIKEDIIKAFKDEKTTVHLRMKRLRLLMCYKNYLNNKLVIYKIELTRLKVKKIIVRKILINIIMK